MGNSIGKLLQEFDISLLSVSCNYSLQYLQHSLCAFSTWDTLSTGFVLSKVHEESCNFNHTCVAIHDNKTSRTYHSPDTFKVVEVERKVQMLFCKTSTAWSSNLYSLKLAVASHTSTDIEDNLSQCSTHWNFNKTSVCNISCEGKGLCSRAIGSSNRKVPVCSLSDYLGNSCKSLNVVKNSRRVKETMLSSARWLDAREASLTFDAGSKGGTFSAYKSSSSLCNMYSK